MLLTYLKPESPIVPGLPGVTIIWPNYGVEFLGGNFGFRKPFGSAYWHSDLCHELQTAGYTSLHNDTAPTVGGDTVWASGYSAYEKLSHDFRKIIDGKFAVYRSSRSYVDHRKPEDGRKYVERVHPLVRVHPATGWKTLYVNRAFTVRIVGLDKAESDVILNYLFDIYEKSLDLQVRVKWTPGTTTLWDDR
jgi:alpha-ketoglutarate-dependent taurine dioxygenase